MFIRRTTIKARASGEGYYTYRLVESERVGHKVKQHILINLGRGFSVPREHWKDLCARITQLIDFQAAIIPVELPVSLEKEAQRYVAQILADRSEEMVSSSGNFEEVDVDSLELVRPRSVGVEHLALHAAEQLGLTEILQELGFNRHERAAALGNIIGRMTEPGSEAATHDWLQKSSGLGELIDYDFEGMAAKRLYRASDQLWQHRAALQERLYCSEKNLFGFEETITLYDLTNTYFEGGSKASPLTQRGRSKEKRSDAPLVTLGLVLDGSGFPRSSQIFSGNASEPATLKTMLTDLDAGQGTIVVLDAGIASEENITWLKENSYHYLVVSRKRKRQFDETKAVLVKQTPDQKVQIEKVFNQEAEELELYCHSEAREQKEHAMQDRFAERFEQKLQYLADGLHKKGRMKDHDKILMRIGRLTEKYARAAQHYDIDITKDPDSNKAIKISWKRNNKAGSQATHPGVYCLRTDLTDWSEKELWHTYTMLTDLEAVFRSLKSELGLRPIYHQKTDRISGHLFISLLAYHLVHTLRVQLKSKGDHSSWEQLRNTVKNRSRITVSMQTRAGSTIHIRKSTRAEPHQLPIYDALGLSALAGAVQRTTI